MARLSTSSIAWHSRLTYKSATNFDERNSLSCISPSFDIVLAILPAYDHTPIHTLLTMLIEQLLAPETTNSDNIAFYADRSRLIDVAFAAHRLSPTGCASSVFEIPEGHTEVDPLQDVRQFGGYAFKVLAKAATVLSRTALDQVVSRSMRNSERDDPQRSATQTDHYWRGISDSALRAANSLATEHVRWLKAQAESAVTEDSSRLDKRVQDYQHTLEGMISLYGAVGLKDPNLLFHPNGPEHEVWYINMWKEREGLGPDASVNRKEAFIHEMSRAHNHRIVMVPRFYEDTEGSLTMRPDTFESLGVGVQGKLMDDKSVGSWQSVNIRGRSRKPDKPVVRWRSLAAGDERSYADGYTKA